MDYKELNTETEFQRFDKEHPEKGELIANMKYDEPYNFVINEFLKLEWIILSFGCFKNDRICIKYSQTTGEFFLADMNDGGHTTKCRLVKVKRSKFYNNQAELIEWTANRGAEFWKRSAKNEIN
ncbi:hypothetical protein HZY62_18300 [Maribacter polysiphoniae]|uniref:Uncharacterized protein n=1 Tax=Maribacter polysiphoniae TaxID=429344 RepID=A0A316DUV4_9FLAO|nr:hypothetical protein [Maribacter polysiphoniae]MBD1262556.1 hypothetical protein [Maribacter polysiphoniae]PWK21248.1 hypothetical protein LX92_04049 [Maribacter polysiphoniae]